MGTEKINLKILKLIIIEIAKTNGIALSEVAKKRKLKPQLVEEQGVFLRDLNLLDGESSEVDSGGGDLSDSLKHVKLKQNPGTMQKIIHLLDNEELSKFMRTAYFKEPLGNYCRDLLDSLDKNDLPLPDAEYTEYALRNSPSCVRFFLVDNDISALKSFYQRCITSKNEKVKDRVKIALFEKYDMYLIWDNVIFGKIQDDVQNGVLLDPVNFYSGYLPIVKKTFENLLHLYSKVEKEEKGGHVSDSKSKRGAKPS